ncbi:MAG: hypothetical protein A2942_01845 [Candidatus Lloydbacteria bacterium RIFCSPLOWO2_01_FULL_50_20]|uniref:Uncharacterized protein n=1 Tax=Candidatus Lloydbacteria bacterium RIFCSPLOWO2_01_FULL_50_20 TaxID=1798665 RepID=A0A1G2DE19_9BACT|nr:MAG: hypothetical protein A2942_01845 [Candidatus Lloydbacteria bacterium RIFCSPLOWO2_01_FULL_50_20]
MYNIGEDDDLIQLTQIPQPDPLRPYPSIFTDGDRLFLAYYLAGEAGSENPVPISGIDAVASAALFSFNYTRMHMFGLPNDESLDQHPLSSRGLRGHGAFEVKNSSWVRRLEKTNKNYRQHAPERYDSLRHFIFTFHDNTFECLAEDYTLSIETESITNLMQKAADTR